MQMSNRDMNRSSASLIYRQMQVKTTRKYQLTPNLDNYCQKKKVISARWPYSHPFLNNKYSAIAHRQKCLWEMWDPRRELGNPGSVQEQWELFQKKPFELDPSAWLRNNSIALITWQQPHLLWVLSPGSYAKISSRSFTYPFIKL